MLRYCSAPPAKHSKYPCPAGQMSISKYHPRSCNQHTKSTSRWSCVPPSTSTTYTDRTQVQAAIQNKIPFAVKSGGNSPWSTISSPGWILDLSKLDTYSLDIKSQTATFGPGVLSKTINLAVEDHGFCIQSPGSALVSCVGFLLGGGSSFLNGLYGVAVDSLISARVVTTKGTVTCSINENSDLFWAIKGAGQFFGVVTEVMMKIYPLEKEQGPLS